ncbi:MAG: hypothetical protein AB7F89_01080 [Pirellulaceae bacterium]
MLFALLGLALFALWYDYKVARPAVEAAYDTIEKYNGEVNTTAGRAYVTEKEIQEKLGRAPDNTFTEGPYHIEEYNWRAGIPIRTHKYYAVYSDGTPLIFLKHFKFELPPEELAVSGTLDAGVTPKEDAVDRLPVDDGEGTATPDPAPAAADVPAGNASNADVPAVDAPLREESVVNRPKSEPAVETKSEEGVKEDADKAPPAEGASDKEKSASGADAPSGDTPK